MRQFLCTLLSMLFLTGAAYAQRVVTGTVTDQTGQPLIGANVLAKEAPGIGTITDVDGNYRIQLPSNALTLVYSYTGYDSKEIAVGNSTVINVTLSEGKLLDEVVVVGYGTATRKELTGSVAKIDGNAISRLTVTSLDQAMQGQAAGVQVTTASGTPGSTVNIKVRGNSSITSGSQPLYVIDGVPINQGDYSQIGFGNQGTNALANLNPADIQSIEVLKDAAAAAIYGSRASNGVVLITTKRGSAGATKIGVSTSYGIQSVWRRIPSTTGPEYVALVQEMVKNRLGPTALPSNAGLGGLDNDPSTYPSTDWQSEIFRNAPMTQTDLSFSGGNERTKFFISGSYFKQDGTVKGSSFDRYSFRVNLDNLVSEKFKVGTSTNFSRSLSTRINNDNNIFGVLSTAVLLGSHIPVFNADGTYGRDRNASIENPVAAYREPTNDAFNNRLISSVYGEYTLAKGLNFRSSVSVDYIGFDEFRFSPTTTNAGAGTNGTAIKAASSDLNLVNENFFTYRTNFGAVNFDGLLGASFQKSTFNSFFGQGENFPGNTIKTLNAASVKRDVTSNQSAWGLNSYFSRFNFSMSDKYFLSLSVRADGSSRFGANNRWGVFPAASAAWVVSDEDFFGKGSTLSNLKLRASWGLRGNQEIGNFASRGFISPGTNYLQRAGLAPTSLGNPDLTWEQREDIDLGLDIGLFNNNLNLIIDVFKGTTNELLLSRPLVGSSGFTGITENIGSVENRGIEVALNAVLIDKKDFNWNTTFNISFVDNKVLALAGTPFAAGFASWVEEGYALGSFRGFKVERLFQTQDEIDALNAKAKEMTGNPNAVYQTSLTRPGDIMFRDLNGDGVITTADQEILGHANPKFFGGITNNFTFKGFDLSFFFQYSYGNLIYNNTRAFSEGMNSIFGQSATVANRWTPENPTTDTNFPRAVFGDPNNNRRTSDRFLEDGSYLRLKNLTFGYNLPGSAAKKLGMNSLRLSVIGQNLLTFTGYKGFDPEVSTFTNSNTSPGTDFLTFPQARVISFKADVVF